MQMKSNRERKALIKLHEDTMLVKLQYTQKGYWFKIEM